MTFFSIKVDSAESLHRAYDGTTWATPLHRKPPHPHEDIAIAYDQQTATPDAPVTDAAPWDRGVFLVFSVNGSRCWCAIARVAGRVQEHNIVEYNNRPHVSFSIEWLYRGTIATDGIHGLPFKEIEDLSADDLQNPPRVVPLSLLRNCQPISPTKVGVELCRRLVARITAHAEAAEAAMAAASAAKRQATEASALFYLADDADDSDAEAIWSEFLPCIIRRFGGRILYAGLVGSRRYGTHTPTSDCDLFVVYSAETDAMVSLHPPSQLEQSVTGQRPDYVVMEATTFAKHVESGDPRCIECLYDLAPRVAAPEWLALVAHRSRMLSAQTVAKYLSEALGKRGLGDAEKMLAQCADDIGGGGADGVGVGASADIVGGKRKGMTVTTEMLSKAYKQIQVARRLVHYADEVTTSRSMTLPIPDGAARDAIVSARAMIGGVQQARSLAMETQKLAASVRTRLPVTLLAPQCEAPHVLSLWLMSVRTLDAARAASRSNRVRWCSEASSLFGFQFPQIVVDSLGAGAGAGAGGTGAPSSPIVNSPSISTAYPTATSVSSPTQSIPANVSVPATINMGSDASADATGGGTPGGWDALESFALSDKWSMVRDALEAWVGSAAKSFDVEILSVVLDGICPPLAVQEMFPVEVTIVYASHPSALLTRGVEEIFRKTLGQQDPKLTGLGAHDFNTIEASLQASVLAHCGHVWDTDREQNQAGTELGLLTACVSATAREAGRHLSLIRGVGNPRVTRASILSPGHPRVVYESDEWANLRSSLHAFFVSAPGRAAAQRGMLVAASQASNMVTKFAGETATTPVKRAVPIHDTNAGAITSTADGPTAPVLPDWVSRRVAWAQAIDLMSYSRHGLGLPPHSGAGSAIVDRVLLGECPLGTLRGACVLAKDELWGATKEIKSTAKVNKIARVAEAEGNAIVDRFALDLRTRQLVECTPVLPNRFLQEVGGPCVCDPPADIRELVAKLQIPVAADRVLFLTKCGSAMYGLAAPTSDVDYYVVVAEPTIDLLKLGNDGVGMHKQHAVAASATGSKADEIEWAIMDAGVFVTELLKGNPKNVEPIFAPVTDWESPAWVALKAHCIEFVTGRLVRQYFGFFKDRLRNVEKAMKTITQVEAAIDANETCVSSEDTVSSSQASVAGSAVPTEKERELASQRTKALKMLYHVHHKLFDLKRILNGGTPYVMSPPDERARIMELRCGDGGGRSLQVLVAEAEAEIQRLHDRWDAGEHSVGREECDETLLLDWLRWVRGV